MSPQLAAHERLLQQLPVRTVQGTRRFAYEPATERRGFRGHRPTRAEVLERNRRVVALRAAGYTYSEIRAATGAAYVTINRLINKGKTFNAARAATSRRR